MRKLQAVQNVDDIILQSREKEVDKSFQAEITDKRSLQKFPQIGSEQSRAFKRKCGKCPSPAKVGMPNARLTGSS